MQYLNLKLYLNNGMEINHINKLVQFKQKNFIKDYIDKNTLLRNEGKK